MLSGCQGTIWCGIRQCAQKKRTERTTYVFTFYFHYLQNFPQILPADCSGSGAIIEVAFSTLSNQYVHFRNCGLHWVNIIWNMLGHRDFIFNFTQATCATLQVHQYLITPSLPTATTEPTHTTHPTVSGHSARLEEVDTC